MVNEKMLALGTKRSCIRELFEYGLKQAALVGKENVYDYSIGNPSIPAPPPVNAAFVGIVETMDPLAVHGYTPAPGAPDARKAVVDELNARYGASLRPENLFFTCGAAPALCSVLRALAVDGAEVVGVAPFFPEYTPFVECSGAVFRVVPADRPAFQIDLQAMEDTITAHTQAVLLNSPNNPSGVIYTRETLSKLGALLAKPAFRAFKKDMDYNAVGGAPMLGVQGAVVKAHGSSGDMAIMNALRQAREMLEGDVVGRISEGLKGLDVQADA